MKKEIPLGKQRQADLECQVILGYIGRPYLKKIKA
jgi:hypothetical protein